MASHLFGSVLTASGIAANNRGENAGNVQTLQKIIKGDQIHSTVSAEAIRYAMREHFGALGLPLNRTISADGSEWSDPKFEEWQDHLDDDLLGYMRPDKETDARRAPFEVSRAISTRPWTGDVAFNVAAVGAAPSGNQNPIPYGTEVHATRYQFTFALTPDALHDPARASDALRAMRDLHRVAGNHARFFFDFSPEAVVLRWTDDPAPRMMYCFAEDEQGSISVERLIGRVESDDIDAAELVVGGVLGSDGERLRDLGVETHNGIKKAFDVIEGRVMAE